MSIITSAFSTLASKIGLTIWGLILTLFSATVTFFSPIGGLLCLITLVSVVDLFSAVLRDRKKIVGTKIQSHKLRATSIKITFYLVIIMILFAIPAVSFEANTIALYTARIATFSFATNELFSIAENASITTGQNIFNKVVKKAIKSLTEFTNKLISDNTKNPENK